MNDIRIEKAFQNEEYYRFLFNNAINFIGNCYIQKWQDVIMLYKVIDIRAIHLYNSNYCFLVDKITITSEDIKFEKDVQEVCLYNSWQIFNNNTFSRILENGDKNPQDIYNYLLDYTKE